MQVRLQNRSGRRVTNGEVVRIYPGTTDGFIVAKLTEFGIIGTVSGTILSGQYGMVDLINTLNWSDIMGVPEEFAPEAHRHDYSDLDNVPDVPQGGGDMLASIYDPIIAGKKVYHGVASYSGLAFNDSGKYLGLTAITYWYKGTQVVIAVPITCDLDLVADRDNSANSLTTDKLYFFYFKDATGKLYWSDAPWNFRENVFVATVFWNGTNGACQAECHNHTRDIDWHIWAHDTIGTRYESGFDLTAPTTVADGTLNIGIGTIHDEDQDKVTGVLTTMRGWYQNTVSTFTFRNYALPYLGVLGAPVFLNTAGYTLDTFAASDFACYWLYASLDVDRPLYVIPTHGTSAFNTLNLARANTAPVTIGVNNEYKLIYKFIYSGNGQFQELVDYRSSSPVPGGGTPTVSAQQVSFAIGGGLSSTNVQDALIELDTEKLNASKVSDVAYNATTWDNNTDVPTKNAIRDKIETMGGSGLTQAQVLNLMI